MRPISGQRLLASGHRALYHAGSPGERVFRYHCAVRFPARLPQIPEIDASAGRPFRVCRAEPVLPECGRSIYFPVCFLISPLGSLSMSQPGAITESVIEIRNLTKIYRDFWGRKKVRAVNALSLDVRKGEVF